MDAAKAIWKNVKDKRSKEGIRLAGKSGAPGIAKDASAIYTALLFLGGHKEALKR